MSATAQTLVLTGRNLTRLRREPRSLLGAIVFPCVFFGGFLLVLRRIMEQQGIDYAQYLPPAVVVQAMFFTAMSSAFFVADDLQRGMLRRTRSLPVSRVAVVAARALADATRALVSVTVVVALGFAIGFRFEAGPVPAVGFVVLAVAFMATASVGFGLVAFSLRNPEATVQALSLPYLALLMVSSAFVPVDGFPGWMQRLVEHQPVTRVLDALRALAGGGPTAGEVTIAAAWLIGLAMVTIPLSARRYGKAT